MATQADVRRIALALPEAIEDEERFAFSVRVKNKDKGFVWAWLERIHPKKGRVPQPKVLAVRVADEGEKLALVASDPEKFFTEPHYNGYPAVLIQLSAIRVPELRELITDAWRCTAPSDLVAEFDARPKRRTRKEL
jgi:hypothetical protein